MYFLRKNVSWTGEIEKRREELDAIGIGPTRAAQILSKEFETNITKDMVAGRKKILKKKNGQSNQEIAKNIENYDKSKLTVEEIINMVNDPFEYYKYVHKIVEKYVETKPRNISIKQHQAIDKIYGLE